jgi:hypothetical protein
MLMETSHVGVSVLEQIQEQDGLPFLAHHVQEHIHKALRHLALIPG